MRVAVSGVNGFVGKHLARELVDHGHVVLGLGIGPAHPALDDLLQEYLDVDLTRGWPDQGADAVVHLAALSAVGPSFDEPQRYLDSNSAPLTHLGELALASTARPRIVSVSTGAVYGPPATGPLTEDDELVPSSPYAVSKILSELQAAYYRRRGLDVVVMRPFNHVGPGQGPGFILPDLVDGVRRWRADGTPITVGNLETRRDYTDVRDVVRAYRLVVEASQPLPPVLNVCSGRSTSGRALLDALTHEVNGPAPELRIDPHRLRPNDPPEIVGDSARIRAHLDWAPRIPLHQTVADVLAQPAGVA